ncbi:unnamed protein product, partial [Musa textilis]
WRPAARCSDASRPSSSAPVPTPDPPARPSPASPAPSPSPRRPTPRPLPFAPSATSPPSASTTPSSSGSFSWRPSSPAGAPPCSSSWPPPRSPSATAPSSRSFPTSALLRRVIDRRLVVALALAVILIELALTRALPQLLLAVGIGLPIILLHAVFRVRDDLLEDGDEKAAAAGAAGELGSVLEKKEDLELGSQ